MDKPSLEPLVAPGTPPVPCLDFSGEQPLIQQIAHFYREQIRSGAIPEGRRLPTCVELGRSLGLAPQTVDRAFVRLARERLVHRRRSRGTIVGLPRGGALPGSSASVRSRTLAPPVSMVVRRPEGNIETNRLLFNDYLNGLMEGFDAWKCRFEIAYLRPEQPDVELVRTLVETGQTRGFINLGLDRPATEYLIASKTPMVVLNTDLSARGVCSVIADHVHGYREAWKHANELGHRRTAFFGTADNVFETRLRECHAGRELAGARGRLATPVRVSSDADAGTIWAALTGAFGPRRRGGRWPTLLFAQNDWIAMRLIRALEEHCVNVPKELSLIGFDDSPIARQFHPLLTTLAKPRLQMALAASRRLLDLLAPRPGNLERRQVFPVRLILRETSVCPKRST